ncbi:MAG: hypothetical protein IPK87_00050 [Planctomycetes bacterium]|nr:hypothetical protein [Planctomycetota bacterium]
MSIEPLPIEALPWELSPDVQRIVNAVHEIGPCSIHHFNPAAAMVAMWKVSTFAADTIRMGVEHYLMLAQSSCWRTWYGAEAARVVVLLAALFEMPKEAIDKVLLVQCIRVPGRNWVYISKGVPFLTYDFDADLSTCPYAGDLLRVCDATTLRNPRQLAEVVKNPLQRASELAKAAVEGKCDQWTVACIRAQGIRASGPHRTFLAHQYLISAASDELRGDAFAESLWESLLALESKSGITWDDEHLEFR